MKRLPPILVVAACSAATLSSPFRSSGENFVSLWQVGQDNNSQAEFGQEQGGATAPPGSATTRDDDYYFAGTFPDPIGILAANEPLGNFERAILTVDPRVRIHFNLDEFNVDPAVRLRLIVDICCSSHGGDLGTSGPISFTSLFNGSEVLAGTTSGVDGAEETFTSDAFTAGDVFASTGDNVVTIERPDAGGGNWMQFDYVRLELDTDSLACSDPICSFEVDKPFINPGETATLAWIADASATLEIDQGIGNVDANTDGGAGSIALNPTNNTTYTLTSTRGGDVQQASVTVNIDIISAFDAADIEVPPGNSTVLSWTVDPSATLVIEPGIGNVDADTVNGVGSTTVTPEAPSTTYTLTATRGPDSETATVTVGANNFADLWQVGVADGGVADLVQESGTSNPPPGNPAGRDDDWYFAGVYPDPIGVVPVDEPLTSADASQGFERALLVVDPTNRIHFNLDEANADPGTNLRLSVVTVGSSLAEFQGFEGPIDFTAKFNGNEVLSSTVADGDIKVHRGVFSAGDVGATTGENIVEISRKTDAGGSWMLFDYVKLETEPAPQEALRITDIAYDNDTGNVTVTWTSRPGKIFGIFTSTDLGLASGSWAEYDDGFPADGAGDRTSLTFLADTDIPAGTERFFVRVREVE